MAEGAENLSPSLPQGMRCVHCRYDLAGLPWGSRCPECGYPAPKAWPTIALAEAHPAFISHLRDRFRGVCRAASYVVLGCAGVTIAVCCSFVPSYANAGAIIGWSSGALLLIGFTLLAIELVHLSIPHRKRRPDLDFPHGDSIKWLIISIVSSLLLLPFLLFPMVAFSPWRSMGCVIIPLLGIAAISALFLLYQTFAHASTTIERCGESPAWSRTQRFLGVILVIWPFTVVYAMTASTDAIVISLFVFGTLVATLLALRMRRAERVVAALLRRGLAATAADPPPEPLRS